MKKGVRQTLPDPNPRPQEVVNSMIPKVGPEGTAEVLVMFRILTRREWEELQDWRRACPGSTVEHLAHGLYVSTIPAAGVGLAA